MIFNDLLENILERENIIYINVLKHIIVYILKTRNKKKILVV